MTTITIEDLYINIDNIAAIEIEQYDTLASKDPFGINNDEAVYAYAVKITLFKRVKDTDIWTLATFDGRDKALAYIDEHFHDKHKSMIITSTEKKDITIKNVLMNNDEPRYVEYFNHSDSRTVIINAKRFINIFDSSMDELIAFNDKNGA